jgi:hypothetical protein
MSETGQGEWLFLSELRRSSLFDVCEEMGIVPTKNLKKTQLVDLIVKAGFDVSEVIEIVEDLLAKLTKENSEGAGAAQNAEAVVSKKQFKVSDFLTGFQKGNDFSLFLINFERICVNHKVEKVDWVIQLQSLLPAECSEVLARMEEIDAFDYAKVREALLKKFQLTREQMRRKFRGVVGNSGESFEETAYRLKATLMEWLKAEKADDFESVVEVLALEQYYQIIPDNLRLWVLDQMPEDGGLTLKKVAGMADDYASRRVVSNVSATNYRQTENAKNNSNGNNNGYRRWDGERSDWRDAGRSSDQRKPELPTGPVCYSCGLTGHTKYRCPTGAKDAREKGTFSLMVVTQFSDSPKLNSEENYDPKNDPNLQDFIFEMQVNNSVEVDTLRDSGTTYDIVHEKLVEPNDYLEKSVEVKWPLCGIYKSLPMAKVVLKGEFGEVITEAAVSRELCFGYVMGNVTARKINSTQVSKVAEPPECGSLQLLNGCATKQINVEDETVNSQGIVCVNNENLLPVVTAENTFSFFQTLGLMQSARDHSEVDYGQPLTRLGNLIPLLAPDPENDDSKHSVCSKRNFEQESKILSLRGRLHSTLFDSPGRIADESFVVFQFTVHCLYNFKDRERGCFVCYRVGAKLIIAVVRLFIRILRKVLPIQMLML